MNDLCSLILLVPFLCLLALALALLLYVMVQVLGWWAAPASLVLAAAAHLSKPRRAIGKRMP